MTPSPPAPYLDDTQLPLVGEDRGNRPMWIAIAAIAFGGVVLLGTLESRRADRFAPSVKVRATDLENIPSAQNDLYVPPEPVFDSRLRADFNGPNSGQTGLQPAPPKPLPDIRSARAERPSKPERMPAVQLQPTAARFPPEQRSVTPGLSAPAIVYEASGLGGDNSPARPQSGGTTPYVIPLAARARPAASGSRLAIIPQGTLIAAVLENAIDSTQPGQLRALVTANVFNLRGDRVLVPKGSRLYGEYRGELAAGQKRAQVQWGLLVRPDGVSIALDSPAADQLGRAGINGRVNSHFFARLGGALLQSSIDVATISATRSISDSAVIVGVPSAVQSSTSQLIPAAPKPTLRVRQGTSISVLVARDLDFSSVETAR